MTDSRRGPDQPDPGSHGNDGWGDGEHSGVTFEELSGAYAEAIVASTEMAQRIECDRNNLHRVISMTIMPPMLADLEATSGQQALGDAISSRPPDGVLDDLVAFMRMPADEFSDQVAALTDAAFVETETLHQGTPNSYRLSPNHQALLERLAGVCSEFDTHSPLGFSRALLHCGGIYADAIRDIEDHHTAYFTIEKFEQYKAIKSHADFVTHHVIAALERPEHWPHAKKELQALVLYYGLPRVLFGVVDVLLPGDRLDPTNETDRLFVMIFAARAAAVDSDSGPAEN